MAHTSIGAQKIRRVGSDLVVTIPKETAEALGLREGDMTDVALRLLEPRPRPPLRPNLQAAVDAALAQIEPGLRYLADK